MPAMLYGLDPTCHQMQMTCSGTNKDCLQQITALQVFMSFRRAPCYKKQPCKRAPTYWQVVNYIIKDHLQYYKAAVSNLTVQFISLTPSAPLKLQITSKSTDGYFNYVEHFPLCADIYFDWLLCYAVQSFKVTADQLQKASPSKKVRRAKTNVSSSS